MASSQDFARDASTARSRYCSTFCAEDDGTSKKPSAKTSTIPRASKARLNLHWAVPMLPMLEENGPENVRNCGARRIREQVQSSSRNYPSPAYCDHIVGQAMFTLHGPTLLT